VTYRDEVLAVARPGFSLINAALGLTEESGEVAGLIKKAEFHGRALDREALIKELGDVRWYLEIAAHCLGVTMGEVEERNVAKLKERYPNGFVSGGGIR
jgi:NTP pyrophosphatase (non-canonical NTP hydrolase)